MSHDLSRSLPHVAVIRQNLVSRPLERIESTIRFQLVKALKDKDFRPGQSVALAVGSRNIHSIVRVVALCAAFLQEQGLKPFLVPAMGSHGGATAQGQRQVLENLGIASACPGVPIRPSMDTELLGNLQAGNPVFFSREALQADHLVVINRVKPHTKFKAPIQSGLCKMLCVGLGKHQGAAALHRAGVQHGFSIIEEAAALILKKIPLLAGLALVEDGLGQLSQVRAFASGDLIAGEKSLLLKAQSMMPAIPFDNLDVLVVDQIGKDISGIGMDSNVTGRHRDLSGDFFLPPNPKRIFVRDLSPGSGGNANGIGLADFTTTRLVRAMDLKKTFVNSITAISPEKAAIPIHFDTDRETLEACLATTGLEDWSTARLARIKTTGSLEHIQVSSALEQEVKAQASLEIISDFAPMAFDSQGNLGGFHEKK
ncbi:MAG: DUF362 domain-containing protein [Desulfatibacillum sp.]|nr:DUF362 domain-containing protein [Desulfatibacillum sp.]